MASPESPTMAPVQESQSAQSDASATPSRFQTVNYRPIDGPPQFAVGHGPNPLTSQRGESRGDSFGDTPEADRLIHETFIEQREALPGTAGPANWDSAFQPLTPVTWLEYLLGTFHCAVQDGRAEDNLASPRLYDGVIEIFVHDRDVTRMILQVQVVHPSENATLWTVAALKAPSDARLLMTEKGWNNSGDVLYCDFLDVAATAEAIASVVCHLSLDNPDTPHLRVRVNSLEADDDSADWAALPMPAATVVLERDLESWPTIWPGSDRDVLTLAYEHELPEHVLANFSTRGELVEPITMDMVDRMIMATRAAGYTVEEAPQSLGSWVSVTVFPKQTTAT